MVTEKAKWIARVVGFFEEFSKVITEKAFKVKKSSIYKWRKLLKDNQGRLEVLNDRSKAPKSKRKAHCDSIIMEFIKDLREKYQRIRQR